MGRIGKPVRIRYVPDTVMISPLPYHWHMPGRGKWMLESKSGDLPKDGIGDDGKVPTIIFLLWRGFFVYLGDSTACHPERSQGSHEILRAKALRMTQ